MGVLQDPQHESFAQSIALGKAPRLAYEAAGYKVGSKRAAIASASRLRNRPDVAQRILELQIGAAKLVHVDRAFIVQKLVRTLAMAMGEAPRPRTIFLRGSKGKRGKTEIIQVLDVDTMAANRAAELLGKEIGMFIDRSEVGAPGDFARLTDEELRERVRDIYASAGVKVIDHDPGEVVEAQAIPNDPMQLSLVDASGE
jgi:phage terminase small subunit